MLLPLFKTQNTEWPYFSYIRTLFEDVGLDHFIEGNFKINTFNRFFGMNNKIKEREIIETKTDDLDVINFPGFKFIMKTERI